MAIWCISPSVTKRLFPNSDWHRSCSATKQKFSGPHWRNPTRSRLTITTGSCFFSCRKRLQSRGEFLKHWLASENLPRVLEPSQILTCEHSQVYPSQVNFNLRLLASRLRNWPLVWFCWPTKIHLEPHFALNDQTPNLLPLSDAVTEKHHNRKLFLFPFWIAALPGSSCTFYSQKVPRNRIWPAMTFVSVDVFTSHCNRKLLLFPFCRKRSQLWKSWVRTQAATRTR